MLKTPPGVVGPNSARMLKPSPQVSTKPVPMGLNIEQPFGFASLDFGNILLSLCLKSTTKFCHDEILSRRNSEKLSEIFFDEFYPPKIYLTKKFCC